MIPDNVKKYLKKYSLPGWEIEHAGLENINNVAVIPAISELDNIKILLTSLADNESEHFPSTLFLFVVNNPAGSNNEVKGDNKKTIDSLRLLIKSETGNYDDFRTKVISSGLRIAFVDASSPGKELPSKDAGVGLARKIGMDLALTLFNYDSREKKILICLDADCKVEKNYLTSIVDNFNTRNLSAAAVNFSHHLTGSDEQISAIICYEIFLRYYVLGLKYACSHYAFHTIGSTMACDYEAYLKAEGMNKKKAAEDFYFMEKLAKNVKVEHISETTVYPSSRGSWRVPFGTGQRVNRFLAHTHNEYLLYNPGSFRILKEWITEFNSPDVEDAGYYLTKAAGIDLYLHKFLVEQKFSESWNKILQNSASNEQANKQKIKWFDGFRTLKLIHYLRDSAYPPVNMFDAIDDLFKMAGIVFDPKRYGKTIPSLEIQNKYLKILRDNT